MFVGARTISVYDKGVSVEFPVLVHYPTDQPSTPTAFGPFTMDVAVDTKIAGGRFPLVVLSHGGGGSNMVYRTIATHLARNGYVVALPKHNRDNKDDSSLSDTVDNLLDRPVHVSLTISALLEHPDFRDAIDENRIGMIGHSMGGYTALALAGGIPWTRERRQVEVQADKRIKALVLMAPAAAFFAGPGSFEKVNLPIQLLAAEHDHITPAPVTDLVRERVPDRSLVEYHLIKKAGHLSFLSPYPDQMVQPNFPPSQDPPGFDRKAFHKELPGLIEAFLGKHV